MSGRDWKGMAAAYVLGALESEEHADFEAELARNEWLRNEVAALTEASAEIGRSVPQVAPPPALRERVLSEAGRVRPIPSGPRRPAVLPWTMAAAAALAALALGIGYGGVRSEVDGLQRARTDLEEALASARADLARQDSILATFAGPDVRAATLSTPDQAPSVRVFLDPARSLVVVAAFDLAPAPPGRTYQLWGIVGGQDPVSLGTFDTAPDGTALLALGVPAGSDFQVSAVTEEPEGGSPQPTTQPFLVGNWRAVD